MKKTIILFAAMVVALGAAATDRFHIEDFTISPGETRTVSILLDNEAEYTAFQSDLYLPEGLTAANFALTDRKNANHTLTATVLPDGGIRLLSYSLNLKTYSGNSGALVTFDVIASEDFEGPVEITLRSSLFTTEAGIEVPFDDESCTVTLKPTVIVGDVNGDGNVTMSDVTALIDILLSGETAPQSADCNNDTNVTFSDVTALIDYLLGDMEKSVEIYVKASQAPHLYVWIGESGLPALQEPCGSWPGILMTQHKIINGVTFWYASFDYDDINIIFNNGIVSGDGSIYDNQTYDITHLGRGAHYFTYDGGGGYSDITETFVNE